MRRFGSALFAVATLQLACSDPVGDRACLPAFQRDPGPGCTVPQREIAINGSGEDWSAGKSSVFGELRVARNSAGELLFLYETTDPPVQDGSVTYVIAFRRSDSVAQAPTNSHIAVLLRGSRVWADYNGVPVSGLPLAQAYGASGYELSVPTRLLPYDGEAILEAYFFVRKGPQWVPQGPTFAVPVCWDPSRLDNLCTLP